MRSAAEIVRGDSGGQRGAARGLSLPELAGKSLEAFERYIERQPLNDELAEIARGLGDEMAHPAEVAETKEQSAAAQAVGIGGGNTPEDLRRWTPSRKQLGMLAETVGSEGWTVYQNLMKKRLEILRDAAITVSQNDPLRNKDAVADEWAYHGMYRKVLSEMESMVREQTARLRVKE